MTDQHDRDNRNNTPSRSRGDIAPSDPRFTKKHPRVVESDSDSPPSTHGGGGAAVALSAEHVSRPQYFIILLYTLSCYATDNCINLGSTKWCSNHRFLIRRYVGAGPRPSTGASFVSTYERNSSPGTLQPCNIGTATQCCAKAATFSDSSDTGAGDETQARMRSRSRGGQCTIFRLIMRRIWRRRSVPLSISNIGCSQCESCSPAGPNSDGELSRLCQVGRGSGAFFVGYCSNPR